MIGSRNLGRDRIYDPPNVGKLFLNFLDPQGYDRVDPFILQEDHSAPVQDAKLLKPTVVKSDGICLL